jgi:uroporphyrinogen-III decarboxylase
MLTRRQNFLRTLRHQPHDTLPAVFVVDNFNFPQPLPAGFDLARITSFTDPAGSVELSRYLGLDTLFRITPAAVASKILSQSVPLDGIRTAVTWQTPRGELGSITVQSTEANTVFTVEHPVKELEDYAKLLSLFEQDELAANPANIAESQRYLDIIGDEGIAYAVGPSTPIMDLIRTWVDLEKFVYHLADHPQVVRAVLDGMAEHCCRQYEIIAAHTPCEVIVFWDDVHTAVLSPRLFEEYSVPVQQRYAEIAHRYGKVLVNHTCGRINAFLEPFLRTGIDAVDWVTPAPTGDIDPRQVQALWGEKITMMLAVIPDVMRNGSPDQVEAHLHALLDGLAVDRNLVMLIPPPGGTPLQNIRRVVQVLTRDYGVPLNRSAEYGNILEQKDRRDRIPPYENQPIVGQVSNLPEQIRRDRIPPYENQPIVGQVSSLPEQIRRDRIPPYETAE